ncbi:MAG: archease [Planctomycetes bacterium]|nr:archease [Planctomycetota bacterium]
MPDKRENKWEHFAHKADMGIRGMGPTKAAAFEQAALAMTAIITDLQKIELENEVQISCDGKDDEILFIDWLSKVIYEMDNRNMLFGRFEVEIDHDQLTARAWGEDIVPEKHEPAVEVKAATYSELRVYKDKNGNWVAQCVVDV